MDRNGFRTVRKHGQLEISQRLLKKRWRRLKVKQRARKTFYETSNLAGENINEGKAESKDKSASFVTEWNEKKYSSLPSSASSNYSVAIKIFFF